MASRYTLREKVPGYCPVCRKNWSSDPEAHCDCTRPRPGDEDEMAKAYRLSAAHSNAKFQADMLDAARRTRAASHSHQHSDPGSIVVPITRPLTHPRPYTTRAR